MVELGFEPRQPNPESISSIPPLPGLTHSPPRWTTSSGLGGMSGDGGDTVTAFEGPDGISSLFWGSSMHTRSPCLAEYKIEQSILILFKSVFTKEFSLSRGQ